MKRKRNQPKTAPQTTPRPPSSFWPWIQAAFILAASFTISFKVWAPSLAADWGPIDDHVVHSLLGSDHRMSLAEVPGVVWGSETGHPGSSLRYRPSYWLITALECVFFGDSVRAWYQSRVIGFALMLAGAWFLLARLSGFLLGSGFALLLSTHAYWGGVWACLGPGEPFAALGVVIGAMGFWLVIMQTGIRAPGRASPVDWLMVLSGGLVAMGSKENLPFLALPPLWLAWREWRAGRLSRWAIACSACLLGSAAFISIAVAVALVRHGADVYARPVGASSRLAVVWSGIRNEPLLLAFFGAAVLLWVALECSASRFSRLAPWRRVGRAAVAWEALLLLLYAGQLVFYNGPWEKDSRYAFPGEILLSLAWFAPVVLFWRAWPRLFPQWLAARRFVAAAACAAMLFTSYRAGYTTLTAKAEYNRAKTSAWAGALRNLVLRTQSDPAAVLVIYSRSLSDFEAIDASRRYLRFLGAPNPVVFAMDPVFSTAGWAPAHAAALMETLHAYTRGEGGFASPALLERSGGCYLVSFGPPPASKCRFQESLP